MSISEDQLETWSHLGQTGQFMATYQTIKAVLDDHRAPYANREADSFLQGSYKNDTNVHGDSDVDIVLRTKAVYYSDTGRLKPDEKAKFDKGWSRATYQLSDFKNEVVDWLRQHYGSAVVVGPKAITITGNGSRRDADVLVCAEFRRYYSFQNEYNPNVAEGICFFLPDGTKIENFPEQHHDNCTSKHQGTHRLFKPTVRVYKNLRNKLIEDRLLADGVAPSYFLEGMLYNVPPDRFGGTHSANFIDTLNWIIQADRSKFECANEQFYLLFENSPVTWTAAKCNTFLNAAINYWNK
jgi:hypothetical protein